jgi:hypothetical protein
MSSINGRLDPFEYHYSIGTVAALNGDRFRLDGSYQYGGIIRVKP